MTDTTTVVTLAADEEIEAWRHTWETMWPQPDWSIEASLIARIDAERTRGDGAHKAWGECLGELTAMANRLRERDATIARLREALESFACPSCGGSGKYMNRSAVTGSMYVTCKVCGGDGKHPKARAALEDSRGQ